MSSLFVSQNNGASQLPEPTRPKRPRSSLACIRCRKKKVKCDFIQPTCNRCAAAGLPCSYQTPPRRVDGHAFDQLGNHVEELKERMFRMQAELSLMRRNLHPFATSTIAAAASAGSSSSSSGTSVAPGVPTIAAASSSSTAIVINNTDPHHPLDHQQATATILTTATSAFQIPIGPPAAAATTTPMALTFTPPPPPPSSSSGAITTQQQRPTSVAWKLSLSPSGLRIDTNIASVADLYRILLNGISQLNINNKDASISLFSTPEVIKGVRDNRKQQQRGNNNASGSNQDQNEDSYPASIRFAQYQEQNSRSRSGGVLEIDERETRKMNTNKGKTQQHIQSKMDNLMQTCYHSCFIVYQMIDKDTFTRQYINRELDPLLMNSINAWMSKHGCIFHHYKEESRGTGKGKGGQSKEGVSGNSDPTTMGEDYFNKARQLLKKRFDISNPMTIHALLHLYMYQLNCEQSNLAYLYIGLAIRMAQDLKFHKKHIHSHDNSDDAIQQQETNKRLWWTAYWLDLCAALESNRPTMVDDKECDIDYPTRLPFEDDDTGYRLHLCTCSIKLMRIRKEITKHLPIEQSGQALLSAISRLENTLTHWMNDLPHDLQCPPLLDDQQQQQEISQTQQDVLFILHMQYQTTWIMLHKPFLPKKGQTATPVALLSLNLCTQSANTITKMMTCTTMTINWCQFGLVLDGVEASVMIHQWNALSHETDVAHLAQRNLIMTANLLKSCPLIYMDKVHQIIQSIGLFLKKHHLPEDIQHVPPFNDDSVNHQSHSSVFHPDEFVGPSSTRATSLSIPSTETTVSSSISVSQQQQQQLQQHHQQHQQSTLDIPSSFNTGNIHQSNTPSPSLLFPSDPMAAAESTSSSSSLLTSPVPMSMSPSPQPPTINIQQPPTTTTTTTVISMGPQEPLHVTTKPSESSSTSVVGLGLQQLQQQQQQQQEMMTDDTSNFLLHNYNALMGFNTLTNTAMPGVGIMTTPSPEHHQHQQHHHHHHQHGGSHSGSHHPHPHHHSHSMDSFFMGFDTSSPAVSSGSSETFTQNMLSTASMGPPLFTGDGGNNNNNNNNEMFATLTDTSMLTTQHHHHHQQQQQQQQQQQLHAAAGYPPNMMNHNHTTNTPMMMNSQQQQFFAIQQAMRARYAQQQGNFDPNLFLNPLDPTTAGGGNGGATMNHSLLTSPSSAANIQQQSSFNNHHHPMASHINTQQQQQQHSISDAFITNNTTTTTTTPLPPPPPPPPSTTTNSTAAAFLLQQTSTRKRMREWGE
ncbi:fungal-specific transcription factor domain-containing protein [Phascolomyces articulosus]|uniref:Fungal-specific transcription factor domain-containing protein n=1 Tax=Phascolomyces articulosus TaxID=60185 RepID=A0AAD5P931_9FUNG|nr:fungal-specific transcription factor domain-containing protein [Phascolomyces articulosus]